LDVSIWPAGFYVLVLDSGQEVMRQRFVVVR